MAGKEDGPDLGGRAVAVDLDSQRLGIEVRQKFLAVLRREEPHQVGDVRRMQRTQQLA